MMQDGDGLPLDEVGDWATEKHERLQKYIDITRATRRKYITGSGGAAYIDLFCGSGRAIVRNTQERIDGSPLLAYKCAKEADVPFTEIHIADVDEKRCQAAAQRIAAAGGSATSYVGRAEDVAPQIAKALNPYGLHLAFLDPFNLGDLPFTVIQALGSLKRMDMLIHVSTQDLQRNLHLYSKGKSDALDRFAPGWKQAVNMNQPAREVRREVIEYWKSQVRTLGLPSASRDAPVVNSKQMTLYWLVFVSRRNLARQFWEKIRSISDQRELDFG